jgi:hypothetical protein
LYWRLEPGSRRLKVGGWGLGAGGWRLEDGGWRLGNGGFGLYGSACGFVGWRGCGFRVASEANEQRDKAENDERAGQPRGVGEPAVEAIVV